MAAEGKLQSVYEEDAAAQQLARLKQALGHVGLTLDALAQEVGLLFGNWDTLQADNPPMAGTAALEEL